jgi:tripartite-type tricarboxylate transporter receptor subunit TctC
MKFSIAAVAISAATVATLGAGSALAQNYPAKPVRVIVPFDPGGSTDIIGRTLGAKLNEYWDQTVLVENRPGASTQIGTSTVARSAPDGYTLLITPASFATNPTLYAGKLPYDTVNDFTPIVLINTSPLVLVVNPNSPYKTVKDLIAAAKAKPGALNFGSSAIGGSNHLSGELFNVMADIKTVHIPYKGNAPRAHRPGGRTRGLHL